MNRRTFLQAAGAAAAVGALGQSENPWGGPVLDMHFHMRRTPEENAAHLNGAGVSNANLLTRAGATEQVRQVQAQYPGRFVWFSSADITKPEAEKQLTQAIKDGAGGFGEIKFHVAADGPELRRMYALAADLDVPILIHFQEVGHTPAEGVFSTGFAHFEKMLKAYPKTRFIGHADAFWANISAGYANDVPYPTGPVKRGGITDKLLSDYPNLFGDLSANSGNNALTRDPGFTQAFLARHRAKLMFGSDCPCRDGNGAGTEGRLAGKCIARETLAVVKKSASSDVFREITWQNCHKLLRLNS